MCSVQSVGGAFTRCWVIHLQNRILDRYIFHGSTAIVLVYILFVVITPISMLCKMYKGWQDCKNPSPSLLKHHWKQHWVQGHTWTIWGFFKSVYKVPSEYNSQNTWTLLWSTWVPFVSGFLYGETERKEQEVGGQLVPLCPNGSYDVVVFLEEATSPCAASQAAR